jgi:DNA-binding transcriptional LysR family regulator
VRLEQLGYLRAIAHAGSFLGAAADLEVAQPSMSQAIKALEQELGARLLERGRQGARLTEAGAAVMPYVNQILEAVDAIREEVEGHVALRRGRLDIGTVAAGSNSVLPAVLAEFCSQYPGVEVKVREGGALELQAAVRSSDLEFALIVDEVDTVEPEGIERYELMRGPLVVCLAANHPMLGLDRVHLDQLKRERLIVFRSGYLMHDVVSALIRGETSRAIFETDNTESAKRMVGAGVGVMVIPEFSVGVDRHPSPDVGYVPLADGPLIRLSLAKRRNRPLPRAASVVWEMLARTAT